MVLRLFWS